MVGVSCVYVRVCARVYVCRMYMCVRCVRSDVYGVCVWCLSVYVVYMLVGCVYLHMSKFVYGMFYGCIRIYVCVCGVCG